MAESRWCDFPIAAPHILKFDSNHCAHPQCHWAREQGHGLQTVLGYWDHSHFSTLAVTTVSDAVLVHPLATFHVSFRSATFSYAYMACVTLVDAGQLLRLPWATSPVGSGVLLLLCFWWNVVEAPKLPWGLGPGASFWRDGTISTERLHLGTEHCQTDLTSNWKTIHLRLVLHNLWMVTSCDAKLVGYRRRNCWG